MNRDKRGKQLIITIDGASGTGTTSTALKVAKHLGYTMFSAGNDLRAFSYIAAKKGYAVKIPDGWRLDEPKINELAASVAIETDGQGNCSYEGADISEYLHNQENTSLVALLSQMAPVRESHDERMITYAGDHGGNVVFEGRVTGHVFPEAVKFWLEAHPEKAHERVALQRGAHVAELNARRNELDSTRQIAPMKPAPDAHILDTTDMEHDGAYQAIIKVLEQKSL